MCIQDEDSNEYQYQVIGGLHSVTARKHLSVENSLFSTVQAAIYVGLTDDESLHLAKRHNINSSLTHSVTHKDYVRCIIIHSMYIHAYNSHGTLTYYNS